MTDFQEEFLAEFLDEAGENIASLTDNLLGLENDQGGNVSPERIDTMFRMAHTIKGLSGMLQLQQTNRLTHSLESVLDKLRSGQMTLSPVAIEIMFGSVDLLNALLDDLRRERKEVQVVDEMIDRLSALILTPPTNDMLAPSGPGQFQKVSDLDEVLVSLFELDKMPREEDRAKKVVERMDLSAAMRTRLDPFDQQTLYFEVLMHHNVYELNFLLDRDILKRGRSLEEFFRDLQSLGNVLLTFNNSRFQDPLKSVDLLDSGAFDMEVCVLFCTLGTLKEIRQGLLIDTLEARIVFEYESGKLPGKSTTPVASQSAYAPSAPAPIPVAPAPMQRDQRYIDELADDIAAFEQSLIELEKHPAQTPLINEIFRLAHKSKSSAAIQNFQNIALLAHHLEDVLSQVREGDMTLTPVVMQTLFKGSSLFQECMERIQGGGSDASVDIHVFLASIEEIFQKKNLKNEDFSAVKQQFPEDIAARARSALGKRLNLYMLKIVIHPEEELKSVRAYMVYNVLKDWCEVIQCRPDVLHEEPVDTSAEFLIASEHDHQMILRNLPMENVASAEVTEVTMQSVGDPFDDSVEKATTIETASAEMRRMQAEAAIKTVSVKPAASVPPPPPAPQPLPEIKKETPMSMPMPKPEAPRPAPKSNQEGSRSLPTPKVTPVAAPVEVVAPKPVPPPPAKSAEPVPHPAGEDQHGDEKDGGLLQTMRIDVKRLDILMNLTGELVVNKARLLQIGHQVGKQDATQLRAVLRRIQRHAQNVSRSLAGAEKQGGATAAFAQSLLKPVAQIDADINQASEAMDALSAIQGFMHDFNESFAQLNRIVGDLQSSVSEMRMVPIGQLFKKYTRVVRDLSHSQKKNVRLVLEGEETELDKKIIDELGDPLTHMVRNAVDHGIEPADQRGNKPAQSTVLMTAYREGNQICIKISDDGRGLHRDKLIKKAIERGLTDAETAKTLTDAQVFDFLFLPGFSTAEKVTEVSGRGVGLDIVRKKIEDLNGGIEVRSTPGEGTTFILKLPLTLAIIPVLMVKLKEVPYCLPLESVQEIISIPRKEIYSVEGSDTIRLREEVLSVVRTDTILGIQTAKNETSKLTVVIVGSDKRHIGIVVDELVGEEEIVFKALPEEFKDVDGISGATVLGDGKPCLIFDIEALFGMVTEPAGG